MTSFVILNDIKSKKQIFSHIAQKGPLKKGLPNSLIIFIISSRSKKEIDFVSGIAFAKMKSKLPKEIEGGDGRILII